MDNMFHHLSKQERIIGLVTVAYMLVAGIYFARDFNLEFVIYVGVIVAIFAVIFATLGLTRLPPYLLSLLSFWGLLHVLGGAVPVGDGVLFSWRIYPFLDLGGEFYILKYDQFVHFYLYGVVALVFHHIVRHVFAIEGRNVLVVLIAIMASLGVSAMNEIMEFLIAVTLERHGVGGYHNAMLDLVFNFSGAVLALALYGIIRKLKSAA